MHGNVSVHQQDTVLSACNAVPSGSNSETTAAKHKNRPCRFSPDLLGRRQVDQAVSGRDSSAQSKISAESLQTFFLALPLCSLSGHISVNWCCLRVNNSVVVQGLSGGKEREVESGVGCARRLPYYRTGLTWPHMCWNFHRRLK